MVELGCSFHHVVCMEPLVFFDMLGCYSYNSPLMSGRDNRLPLQVDPFRMAELGREFEGTMELRLMKRLVPLLRTDAGTIQIKLDFGADAAGVRFMHGLVTGELSLQCQRCMGAMRFPLHIDFRLALLRDETQLERLTEEYEPLLVEAVPIYIADVIEDETLLAVPQIPKHDEGECSVSIAVASDELPGTEKDTQVKPNPFAVLAKLKKEH